MFQKGLGILPKTDMSYQPTTVIRDFSNYTTPQLEQTKAALALRMPLAALAACAAYYKSQMPKRDPSLTELRLLDALATLPPAPEELAVRELFTDDAFVAETYADMMNKRRELNPNAQSPITLREALGLASAYLSRIGKAAPANVSATVALAKNTAILVPEAIRVTTNNAPALTVNMPDRPVLSGDLFLLIHRAALPEWRFQTEWKALLAEPAFAAHCKKVLTLPSSGLLPTILSMTNGVFLALDRLQPVGAPPAMELLINSFAGFQLVVISAESREAVVEAVKNAELGISVIGSITAEARTVIGLSPKQQPVAFESTFLRSLLLRAPVTARLPKEPADLLDRIAHTATDRLLSRYIADTKMPAERLATAKGTVSGAYCQTEAGFFRSALLTTLLPLISVSAVGGDYTQASLAAELSLPLTTTAEALGEALSTVLGFYRAQTEMASPAAALSISAKEDATHPALTVYSLAEATAFPSALKQVGNSVYCIAVPTDAAGLPLFDALRHMLTSLAEIGKRGGIASLRVLCNETVQGALTKMQENNLGCRVESIHAPISQAFTLAVLLESPEQLPFAKLGTVEAITAEEQTAPAYELPALTEALTYDGRLNAVVLAKDGDADAAALAEHLRRRSVKVMQMPPQADAVQIARAILLSQAVLLCNIALPDSPAIALSLQTLASAGGCVIGLGDHAVLPDLPCSHSMPHGISIQMLEDLTENAAL